MDFTSERHLTNKLTERRFTAGDTHGILWMPPSAATPVPLILMGQPGGIGMERMYPRLAARAHSSAERGFAALCIEMPGAGGRPPLPGVEQARVELRRAISAGQQPPADVTDRLILPLVEQAVPEWQYTLDQALALPELGPGVGFSGGVIAIAIHLLTVEPRIAAAGLFAGSYVPRRIMDEAPLVTIPLHVLLQWDDEANDRAMALELFDAFGSAEKTLYANMGGHTGVPAFAGEDAARFFARHLGAG